MNIKALAWLFILSLSLGVNTWGSWGGGGEVQKKKVEKDLYKILELPKRASKEEITKQFRKLSKKYHPDINPDAKEKFTDINEAYEILKDPKKRRVYDSKGYEAAKNAGSQNEQQDDLGIFGQFFGGQMKRENKMDDLRIKLKVSLNDLYNGKELEFKYTRNIICPHCRGAGADSEEDLFNCDKCQGQGVILERQQIAPGFVQQFQKQCPKCGGKGRIIKKNCHVCNAEKIIPNIEDLSVFVEKGMKDGQDIKFEDAGEESPDKNPGNLVFIISEGKHATFRRENNDLHTSIDITLKEALLGFQKELIHLDKRVLEVSRTEVTQPGFTIQMKGEGMPVHQRSGDFGNLFIKVNVVFPQFLTEEQIRVATQLFSRRSNW